MSSIEFHILDYLSVSFNISQSQSEIIKKMRKYNGNKATVVIELDRLVKHKVLKIDESGYYIFSDLLEAEKRFLKLYDYFKENKKEFLDFSELFYDGYFSYGDHYMKQMSTELKYKEASMRLRALIDDRDFIEQLFNKYIVSKFHQEFMIQNLKSGIYDSYPLYTINVLSQLMRDKLIKFENIDSEITFIKSHKEIFKLFIEYKRVYLFIIYYILRGDFLEAEKTLNLYYLEQSPERFALLGAIYFFKDFNVTLANRFFRDSFKDFNSYQSNYRYFKDLIPCDIYELAIFTAIKDNSNKTLLNDWYKSNPLTKSDNSFNLLAFYEKVINTNIKPSLISEITDYKNSLNPILTIINIFVYCYLVSQDNWKTTTIKEIGKVALKNGYKLVALDIFNLLIKNTVQEKEIIIELENLQKEFPNRDNISDILDIKSINLKIFDLIEKDLNSDNTVVKSSKKEGRIVWLLNKDLDFHPYVQVIRKNGEYGKLKSVAEQSLNTTYRDFLTKTDNYLVAMFIKSRGYWSYLNLKELENFDMLSEVDNIFPSDENEPTNQIFFEKAKYPISIYEDSGFFKVSLKNITVSSDLGNFNIIKVNKYHYKLVEINNITLKLLKEIEINNPRFTLKEFDKIRDWIQNNKTLDIDSDIYFPEDGRYITLEHQTKLSVEIEYLGDRFLLNIKFIPYSNWNSYDIDKISSFITKLDDSGNYFVIKRDREFEKEILDKFFKKFNLIDNKNQKNSQKESKNSESFFEIMDLATILSILESGEKESFFEIKWKESNKERKNIRFATTKNVVWNISNKNSWFEIDASIELDNKERFYLKEFLKNSDSKPFIKLDSGEILVITSKLRKSIEAIRELSLSKDNSLLIPPHLAENIENLVSESEKIESTKEWRDNIKKLKNIEQMNVIIPSKIEKKLREYQKKGVHWITKMSSLGFGLCLADDMGLGKTVQAIYSILINSEKTVVITPASVLYNWREEIIKFAPQLNPIIYEGDSRADSLNNLSENSIIIVSYDTFQRDSELFYKIVWGWIVLDEAQMIKNSETKRAKSIIKLQGERRLILSGTPIENHLGELWSLFNFLNPLLLGSQKEFLNNFVKPIIDGNELKKKILKNILSPFILRRLKKDVLKELPEKTEKTYLIDFSSKERAFYEALRLKALDDLKSGDSNGNQRIKILAHLTKLRQITCDPSIISGEFSEISTKSENALSIIESIIENGHKVLVFSQFTGYLEKMKGILNKSKIDFLYIDGSISSKKRLELVDEFQSGKTPVFLISLRAGGVGLNLTAANYVIHLDPWWNPAVENQATDRTHRIGQEKNVTVYKMIIKNSIEEKILKLHEEKKWLSSSILDDLDQVSEKLSLDELMNLLR